MTDESAPTAPQTYANFTLVGGVGSLDQDHPLNANLRDNGIGLVPRVLKVDEEQSCATLGCGSIMAEMTIPFGWHIFDDGRRTLVFDSGSTVQVNFRIVQSGGLQPEQMIEQVIAQLAERAPEGKWMTMELDGMKTLAVRGLPVEGELLDQVFMYKEYPRSEGLYLETRVTCLPVDTVRVMDMVEIILRDMKFAVVAGA